MVEQLPEAKRSCYLWFDLIRVQHQVKVFDQFLKHRKPKLSQHMVSASIFIVVHVVTHRVCA